MVRCECETCKIFDLITKGSLDDQDRIRRCTELLGRALRGHAVFVVASALQMTVDIAAVGAPEAMGPKPTVNEAGRA